MLGNEGTVSRCPCLPSGSRVVLNPPLGVRQYRIRGSRVTWDPLGLRGATGEELCGRRNPIPHNPNPFPMARTTPYLLGGGGCSTRCWGMKGLFPRTNAICECARSQHIWSDYLEGKRDNQGNKGVRRAQNGEIGESLSPLSLFWRWELGDGRWEKEGEDLSGSFSSVSCLLSLGSGLWRGGEGGRGFLCFSVLVLSGRLFSLISLSLLLAAFWISGMGQSE